MPKKGYKQKPEHIAKLKAGFDNYMANKNKSVIDDSIPKPEPKLELENITEKIEEKVKEITKVTDDKIDEPDVITGTSAEVEIPQQSSILSKILIIILGIIAVGAAMFFFINGGNTNDK